MSGGEQSAVGLLGLVKITPWADERALIRALLPWAAVFYLTVRYWQRRLSIDQQTKPPFLIGGFGCGSHLFLRLRLCMDNRQLGHRRIEMPFHVNEPPTDTEAKLQDQPVPRVAPELNRRQLR